MIIIRRQMSTKVAGASGRSLKMLAGSAPAPPTCSSSPEIGVSVVLSARSRITAVKFTAPPFGSMTLMKVAEFPSQPR